MKTVFKKVSISLPNGNIENDAMGRNVVSFSGGFKQVELFWTDEEVKEAVEALQDYIKETTEE